MKVIDNLKGWTIISSLRPDNGSVIITVTDGTIIKEVTIFITSQDEVSVSEKIISDLTGT